MKSLWLMSITTILVSCSAQQHRKNADEEVYSILKQAESSVFGKPSDFTVNTAYSQRKATDVKPEELLQQSQSGGSFTLSIDEAISYATLNSRDYQDQKERLYIAALNLTGAKHSFNPNLSSSLSPSFGRDSTNDRSGRARLNQSVSQSLLTGGNYSLSLANDFLKYFTGDPRSSASSVISLNILQPLLRGAGKEIAAERLTQSHRNVIYALRNYGQFQNEFARDIVIQYLRLLQQQESVANQYSNYQSRVANTEYLRARAVDRASPQEVSDSEQGELQAKNSWINARSRQRTSLDDFKITLGMPTSAELILKESELSKIALAGLPPVTLTHDQAFKLALKHRMPLLNNIDQFEDQKRQVLIAADRLKGDVNLVTTASLRNSSDTYEKFNFNKVSTEIGLQINLPINRKNERNNYRSSLIQFDSSIRSLSRSYDSLQNLMHRRIREIEQFKQSYEIQKGAVELAENQVEANKIRLKAGTLIFRRLSESQDALIDAQNAVTSALVDYQQARLALYTDIGILNVEKKEFWLQQNPTKQ